MRIVVTGGTGFIGLPLVRRLAGAGHALTVLTRDAKETAELLPVGASVATWGDGGSVDPAILRGADAIVHLAGTSIAARRWSAEQKKAIVDSRVATTRALVHAIQTLAPDERPRALVAASAVGWYGNRGGEVLDEASPPGDGFLADVCRAWERESLAATRHGVRVATMRTGIVLGTQGGALRQMLPPFRLGLGGRIGSGRQWMSWIHLEDVLGLYEHALTHDDMTGAVNATAPEPVTNAEFTRELGSALGRPVVVPVPAIALRTLLGEMADLLLDGQRVIPRAADRTGYLFRFPSLPGALADLCRDLDEELVREQFVPRPAAEVFRFFSDPANLEKLTPEFLHFRILGVSTPELRQDTTIDYRLSLHGVPVRWRSRIDRWEPDRRFVDTQVRGPYHKWIHTHEFEPRDGGTVVRDRVRYALPLAPVGDAVAGRMVSRDLERIFAYRRARLSELLG